MLHPAASFSEAILAIHILAVVIGLGVVFAYPIFFAVGPRIDRRAMPWFHQMQQLLGRRLISPGLVVILIAGIYLASGEHQWHAFYVQWGLAAVVAIGGIGGAYIGPREGKLAELAARDVAATATGAEVAWSAEYEAVTKQVMTAGGVLGLIVVLTVFFMAL
ncbi:MAG: hypothetical protein QOD66_1248, partial [Solirubrobacteraceae bacterium]|nr:hypothetical protein [Solirubrobacteraceae bacterium]